MAVAWLEVGTDRSRAKRSREGWKTFLNCQQTHTVWMLGGPFPKTVRRNDITPHEKHYNRKI